MQHFEERLTRMTWAADQKIEGHCRSYCQFESESWLVLHARAGDLIQQAAVVALHAKLGPETESAGPAVAPAAAAVAPAAAAVEIADVGVSADRELGCKECGRCALSAVLPDVRDG